MKKIIPILLLFSFLFAQDIAFVGNSITQSGYYLHVDSLLVDSMQTNHKTIKFAIPGIAVAVPGNEYKNTTEFQDVLNSKSEYIVIMLGSNDWGWYTSEPPTWGDYWEDEYRNLTDSLMINSKVFLGTITYRIYTPVSNVAIDSMNERIIKIADNYGLDIIDFNSALGTDPTYFYSDGIHPNVKGKQALAIEVYNILKEYLSKLSVDDEYWDAVEDYKEQKKIGWFGCQRSKE